MTTNPYDKFTTQERINLAKQRMSKVVGHILHSLALHENNEIVLYTDILASKISESFAAQAFNLMQDSLFRYSVIRLCTIWDNRDLEYESISTVVDLIDNHDVILELMRETCSQWAGQSVHVHNLPAQAELAEAVMQLAQDSEGSFGRQQGIQAGRALRRAIASARAVLSSEELKVMRRLRDKHLAHALNETREEKRSGPIRQMKFREETQLLEKTIFIARELYCWVNGASFDFEASRKIHRKQSEALWKGCTFDKPLR